MQPQWLLWARSLEGPDGQSPSPQELAERSKPRVLGTYTNGVPFLVERPIGRGRVLFLSTGVFRDWNTLTCHQCRLAVRPHLPRSVGADPPEAEPHHHGAAGDPGAAGDARRPVQAHQSREWRVESRGENPALDSQLSTLNSYPWMPSGPTATGWSLGNLTQRGIYRVESGESSVEDESSSPLDSQLATLDSPGRQRARRGIGVEGARRSGPSGADDRGRIPLGSRGGVDPLDCCGGPRSGLLEVGDPGGVWRLGRGVGDPGVAVARVGRQRARW